MANVLPNTNQADNVTELALVQGGFGREFMVHGDSGVVRATLAFSCFVTPEPGDKVLVNANGKERYILAIIERPNHDDVKMSFPGDVSMESKTGQVSVVAKSDLQLTSASKVSIASHDLDITSVAANVHAANLNVSGDKATSRWREVKSISGVFHMLADTITQRFKNSIRVVDGVDQQTSLNFMQTVRKTLSMRSHHAVITARKDVKIDGERIHMG